MGTSLLAVAKSIYYTHPKNFGNHVPFNARPLDRPSVRTTGIPMSITQLTGIATQMQLEVILEGNGIATRVL